MGITFVAVGNAAGQSAGTTTTASTVTVTPTLPAGSASGDRVFVTVAANNTAGTTPTNWNAVFKDTVVGSGAAGAGTGQRWVSCYWRDYDGVWTMPAFVLTSAAQNTQTVGSITLRKSLGDNWDTPTSSGVGNFFGAAGTAFTATTAAFTTMAGAMLLAVVACNDFVSATAGAITGTNGFAATSNVFERVDGGLATGNDVSLMLHTAAPYTAGSPAGTLTHTMTLSAASEGGVVFAQQTVTAAAKAHTLYDDFSGGINATLWLENGDPAQITAVGDAIRVDHIVTSQTNYLESKNHYNLTDSYAYVRINDFGNQTYANHSVSFQVRWDDKNRMYMLAQNGSLGGNKGVGDAFGNFTTSSIALDTTAHRWWRIRETAGTTYMETAPDGPTLVWTVRWSATNPLPVTSMIIGLQSSTPGGDAGASYGIFDNFNIGIPQRAGNNLTVAVRRAGFY